MSDYYLLALPIGYLLGALPFGVIAGRLFGRIDVRDYGSGKTGMTNVMRTVGVPVAILVLLLDIGKGAAAVALARYAFESPAAAQSAAGLAAMIGHNWPVFIGFRGGRGTATGWGGLFMLWPIGGLIATVVGLSLVAATRYVSLGSVTATIVGCATLIVACLLNVSPVSFIGSAIPAPMGFIWFAIIGGALVVGRHKDNIQRLLKGEERKLGQPAEAPQR